MSSIYAAAVAMLTCALTCPTHAISNKPTQKVTCDAGVCTAVAWHERVVHSLNVRTGNTPILEQLTLDAAGNLFGTALLGGAHDAGTVFRLAHDGILTVLYSFPGDAGGLHGIGSVAIDKVGNIYGTTSTTVFKLSPDGSGGYVPSVLHVFTGDPDGYDPNSGVILDKEGNLYGTTSWGGANGYGTVFKLTSAGEETILHSFTGSDGALPMSGLFRDRNGTLYGTAPYGGAPNCDGGCGTVYKITSDGTFAVLHTFLGVLGGYGAEPHGGVIQDAKGNLYGTTARGGSVNSGTVYELSPTGSERVLYSFGTVSGEGYYPESTLVRDKNGNLFGTTAYGGAAADDGIVFRISKDGAEKIVHAFKGGPKDGSRPRGGLTLDADGNMFGTTSEGGKSDLGTIFKIVR